MLILLDLFDVSSTVMLDYGCFGGRFLLLVSLLRFVSFRLVFLFSILYVE